MENVQLSRNEKMVLYGLTKYPVWSDNDVCKKIQMKQSTFSTIKKKLLQDGYYHTAYDPILQHLGCELLSIWYLKLNRKTSEKERLEISRDDLLAAKNLVVAISESNQSIFLSMSKNISDHVETFDRIVQLYESHEYLEEDVQCILFPFEQSAIFRFFDFAPILNRIFEIESPAENVLDLDVDSSKVRCKVMHRDLSELEKQVYLGLIRYPYLSDSALSEKLGSSRQVVGRLRAKFLEEKLIKKRRIVNMEKLGFEMLVMTHAKFNPNKPLRERQLCIQNIAKIKTPIFNIARDRESVMLTPFKNFEEYQSIHEKVLNFCWSHDSLKEEPITILMSIPRLHEIKWRVYEPLVKAVLNSK